MTDDDYPTPPEPVEHHPRNCRCMIVILIPWRDMIRQSLDEAFGSTDVRLFHPIP